MKIISIDKRLLDIVSLVDNCNVIADIGTDHGYIPIYLLLTNKVKRAYASDVAKGPLSKAIENIDKYNLNDSITPILCDGLKDIPSDVDEIIIAGMGAILMASIIENRKYDYKTMILQPNLQADVLRSKLSSLGYKIIDEKVSFEHKKYYEIIKVTLGNESLNDKQIKYGPINLINRSKEFIDKWSNILNNYKSILVDFKGSNEEYNRINNEIIDIENMLNNK